MYERFLDGSSNLEKTFELFNGYTAEAQVNYNQHLRPEKVLNYLKLIKEKQDYETCHNFYAYILMIHGKYLQMTGLFFIFNDTPDQIGPLFERFNKDFSYFQYSFKKIHFVPASERANFGHQRNAVGVDLVTTYCCVAVVRNGNVEIIPNERGNPVTPSFVGYMNDEVFIGDSAKARITHNPQNTLFDAKSMIIRSSEQLKTPKLINHWPFDLIDFNGEPFYKILIRGDNSVISFTEVRKIKMIAEDCVEEAVTDADT